MAKFKERTTKPLVTNGFYYGDINPWAKKGIGSCTCYAQGRFLELEFLSLGTSKKAYKDTWYPIDMYNKCAEIGAVKASSPKLGGGIVWKSNSLPTGHIAVIEGINGDSITFSQEDSKNTFSIGTTSKALGWNYNGMTLVGFIDCKFNWDTDLTANSYPNYPSNSNQYYRVKDAKGNQLGAYSVWSNAFNKWNEDHTRHVYDTYMVQLDVPTAQPTKTALTAKSFPNYKDDGKSFYRVRTKWGIFGKQKGAFTNFANAFKCFTQYKGDGYHIFNKDGKRLD